MFPLTSDDGAAQRGEAVSHAMGQKGTKTLFLPVFGKNAAL
jgi:hypothetical protein